MKQSDIIINDWILSRELSVGSRFLVYDVLSYEGKYDLYSDIIESTMRVAIFEMQKGFEYFLYFFPNIYILL